MFCDIVCVFEKGTKIELPEGGPYVIILMCGKAMGDVSNAFQKPGEMFPQSRGRSSPLFGSAMRAVSFISPFLLC